MRCSQPPHKTVIYRVNTLNHVAKNYEAHWRKGHNAVYEIHAFQVTTVHGNGLKLSWNYLTYSKVHGNLHLFCTFWRNSAPILNLEVASWNSFGQRPRNASLDYGAIKFTDLFGPLEIATLCLFFNSSHS